MCGKTEVMGCVGLVGGTSSIWFSSRAVLMGWGLSPIRWPEGCQNIPWVLCPGPHLGGIDLVCILLVVMPMRRTHWGLPPLRVGSPSGHGSGWFPMRWMSGWNIYCTWGRAFNALSGGDWWLCPHFGPPSHTEGSGSPHWSGIAHLDHVYLSGSLS